MQADIGYYIVVDMAFRKLYLSHGDIFKHVELFGHNLFAHLGVGKLIS
jgi:hypothetical protein